MQHPSSVLIVSYRHAMQKMTEQLCQRAGSQTVTVEPGNAADRLVIERGLATFALVILDTDVPWEPQWHHLDMARRLLREWTALAPTIPFVLVGTQVQKRALLLIRADIVRFVTKPFEPCDLDDAIKTFLPAYTPQRPSVVAALPQLSRFPPFSPSPAVAARATYMPIPRPA